MNNLFCKPNLKTKEFEFDGFFHIFKTKKGCGPSPIFLQKRGFNLPKRYSTQATQISTRIPNHSKIELSARTSYSASLTPKFLNFLTKSGKKSKAYSIFYKTMILLIKKKKKFLVSEKEIFLAQNAEKISPEFYSVDTILKQSIQYVKPIFEVKKVRIAGTTHQVPSIVPFQRQKNLAIRWIIQGAKEKKKKNPRVSFSEALATEIYDASKKLGYARSKRDELHKIAEANRASSHYRWW
jgi:small subunit ribosomal protein S7